MKEYFVACYFLDQGMEGIPNLTPAFIIEAKNEQEAIKKYPKEIKKEYERLWPYLCSWQNKR